MEKPLQELNESDDFEEEEILVYAEFDSVLDDSMLQETSLFKIIALDSDEPFLQIGTQMYCGKWLDSVGTHLFFEPEEAPPPLDPVFSNVLDSLLNFKFKTRKCLELSRIFINKKQTDEMVDHSNPPSDITDIKATAKNVKETEDKQMIENKRTGTEVEVETAASKDGVVQ
uniref:Transcription factor TFIIIC triple barrel domain-containing protein n=1 Tax=Cuerna arida TaxID=1464854 RepID=A0A1B6G3Q5_9HEMI